MIQLKVLKSVLVLSLFMASIESFAQIDQGIYLFKDENIHHELKVTENYFIHSVYEKSPAKFIKTGGGFYTTAEDTLKVTLEFNSNFALDSISTLILPFKMEESRLVVQGNSVVSFEKQTPINQDLDGQWLFATRGPDEGQERRGEGNTRKTLKYMQDGRFQWIAYDTDGMKFKGTGGGSYTSIEGIYTENIEFFSRDNSRVGASLKFNYEIKDDDWHHTGKNSKGKSTYEIWGKRN